MALSLDTMDCAFWLNACKFTENTNIDNLHSKFASETSLLSFLAAQGFNFTWQQLSIVHSFPPENEYPQLLKPVSMRHDKLHVTLPNILNFNLFQLSLAFRVSSEADSDEDDLSHWH